ncbi:hypothetical protein J4417_02960 [Candidatus Woesearchaeota archaeon]|nr:hypothetical protein [Candidatus Woesearchaeota archaeon]
MKIKKGFMKKRMMVLISLLFILFLFPMVSAQGFLDNLRYGTTGLGLYDTNKTLIDFLFFFTLFLSINWISLKRVYGKDSKERGPLLGIAIVVSLALAIGALKAGLSPSFLIPFMQYIFFFIGVAFAYLIIVWLGKIEKWWAKLLAFLFAFLLVWIILNIGSYLLVGGGDSNAEVEGESFWDQTKATLSEMLDSLWAIPGELIEEETIPTEEPAEETPPEEETSEGEVTPEEDATEETPPEEVPEDTPEEETPPTELETIPIPIEPESTPAPKTPTGEPDEETSAGWFSRLDTWINKNPFLAGGGFILLLIASIMGGAIGIPKIFKYKEERHPAFLSEDLENLERVMDNPDELEYIQSVEDYPWK